jgi:hypothetical protein
VEAILRGETQITSKAGNRGGLTGLADHAMAEEIMANKSTSSPEDSPASLFPALEKEKARQTTVSSGLRCYELYGKYARLGSLAKMLLESSIWHSNRCVLNWKIRAMKSNRFLFQLAVSMPRIKGIESGLWPTATEDAAKSMRSKKYKQGGTPLTYAVKMWPTPTTQEVESDCELTKTGRRKTKDGKDSHSLNLARTVKMWPTPWEFCHKDAKTDRNKGNLGEKVGGSLNPMWVEWLMGFPTGWTDLNV